MSDVVVVHVSGNRFAPFPSEHHTSAIWQELARDVGTYHVFARSATREGSVTWNDNVCLHLSPSLIASEAEALVSGVALVKLVKVIRPDVIVCQCPVFGGLWASVAARRWSIPMLVELHGEHFFRDRQSGLRAQVLQRLAVLVLRRCVGIRVLSEDMRRSVEKTFGTDIASKCTVVPTRVDMNVFSPPKQSYSLRSGLRLITVGSFIPLKNHLALIAEMRNLEDVTLTVVGIGPLRAQYEQAIEASGLHSRVFLRSWMPQSELAAAIADHDVYVHFSTTEALSRSILEAMALGLPVVATDVGFIRGILRDGDNALLLNRPWGASLTRAVKMLQESESLRGSIGRAGRQTILDGYEWSAVFDRYRAWVEGAAATHRCRAPTV